MLPSQHLQGVQCTEAKNTDAAAMSRLVVGKLKAADGRALFKDPELVILWTERSERSTLPSWCGCLTAFPSDWVDVLGRWGAARGDAYVRTIGTASPRRMRPHCW